MRTLISLSLLFVCLIAKAQVPDNVSKGVRNIALYLNNCSERLSTYEQHFSHANIEGNDFADGTTKSFDLTQWTNKVYDDVEFSKQSANALASIRTFPTKQAAELNEHLDKVIGIMVELKEADDFCRSYITTKRFLREEKMKLFYQRLKRVEILFYDVKILQQKIRWGCNDLVRDYDSSTPPLRDVEEALHDVFRGLSDHRPDDIKKAQTLLVQWRKKCQLLASATDLNGYYRHKYSEVGNRLEMFNRNLANYYDEQFYTSKGYFPRFDSIYGRDRTFHNRLLLWYADSVNVKIDELRDINNTGSDFRTINDCDFFTFIPPKFMKDAEPPMPTPEELMAIIEKKQAEQTTPPAPVVKTPPPPTLEGFATNNLIFLLDVSSSMDKPEKLPLLQESLRYLLTLMRPEDNISLVLYSGDAQVGLEAVSAARKDDILNAIESLKSGGKSDINKGLRLAYEVAIKHRIVGGNNRIILATDSRFDIDKKIEKQIIKESTNGIKLSVFFFGADELPGYKKALTELATHGGGQYSYIKSDNAQTILLQEAQSVRAK